MTSHVLYDVIKSFFVTQSIRMTQPYRTCVREEGVRVDHESRTFASEASRSFAEGLHKACENAKLE
jgi:hypothetical protein